MPQASARRVFVYGTLRAGEVNDINRLRPPPRWVGPGEVRGELYDLGWYPGLRLGGDAPVFGEVYEIDPALEAVLDEIEEVHPQATGEYAKRTVPVTVHGALLDCLVYEIAPARIEGKRRIAAGDWLRRSDVS